VIVRERVKVRCCCCYCKSVAHHRLANAVDTNRWNKHPFSLSLSLSTNLWSTCRHLPSRLPAYLHRRVVVVTSVCHNHHHHCDQCSVSSSSSVAHYHHHHYIVVGGVRPTTFSYSFAHFSSSTQYNLIDTCCCCFLYHLSIHYRCLHQIFTRCIG
jgi:hypothetical protein